MLGNYLKTALRNIGRFKGYALINIAGLTVGIACFILIFLWVYDELHYDMFHAHSGQLHRIILKSGENPADAGMPSTPYILPGILKEEYPEIVEVSRVRSRAYPSALRHGDKAFYEQRFFFTDASFFSMFSFEFSAGDPESALVDPYSVVLTREAARKYFGDEDPMGKLLRWNESQDLEVTGVITTIPYNSHLQFDFMASLQLFGAERLSSWWREAAAYVQLQAGVSVEEFNPKIAGVIRKFHPEDDYLVSLQPIRQAHLNILQGGRSDMRIVLLFAVIAVLILMIACVNYMNLSTARSSVRAREVGMRKVLGARRADIIRQFLGESVFLTMISFGLAVFLVDLILPVFNRLQGKEMSLLGSGNAALSLALLGAAVVTGFLAGSYPAFYLSAFRPVRVLKNDLGAGRKSRSGSALRTSLVVSQFSVSILLIIMTAAASRQMRFIRNTDLGFSRDRIIRLLANDQLRADHELFKERLLQDGRIQNVTFASAPPHFLFNVNEFEWEGMEADRDVEINFLYVDRDYAETFGLELVAGRDFGKEFVSDEDDAYIINESAVHFMELSDAEEALGRRVTLAGRAGTVVGVVKDFNSKPLIFDVSPMVMGIRPDWFYDVLVKISPGDEAGAVAHIESVFKEVSPGFPFEYRFLDEWFEWIYSPLKIMNTIFSGFAVLAILISCLGLFGLSSLLLEQRKKEIGIRKILGATVPAVMVLVSKRFLRIILIANLIAVPVSYWAARKFLNIFVARTTLTADLILTTVLFTFAAALVTTGFQVVKTALTDPVNSIRYE